MKSMSKKLIVVALIGMGITSVSFAQQTPGALVSDMYTNTAIGYTVSAQGKSIETLCKEQIEYYQHQPHMGWDKLDPFTYMGYSWRVPSLESGTTMLVNCKIDPPQYGPEVLLPLKCPYGGKIYQSQPTGCYR